MRCWCYSPVWCGVWEDVVLVLKGYANCGFWPELKGVYLVGEVSFKVVKEWCRVAFACGSRQRMSVSETHLVSYANEC